ncbi:metal-dependent hydrolase [Halorussus salilacus]|uniref:metal-dependent hydrolase n=1 Tax=Halorussus salilacus TaxID=2953750 RepID=UPI0020A223DB|nr:metal-dependent hydrolase [Halorussus salilacus]USZ67703.1 metal-dependent hydrolase [Halorussus salilacus]
MPSTLVHVALAGLVGTALLSDHFDSKSVLVVMGAVAFIDFDVFVGLVFPGTHRAAFHTLLLPLAVGALLAYDLRVRERSRSWIRARWGDRGVRIAWVSVFAVTVAGIGPDLFFNGANLFYPLHDRFYELSGHLIYSDQRGFVQTFVDVSFEFLTEESAERTGEAAQSSGETVRTTENTHYKTGVDPSRDEGPEDVERVFYIVTSGERLLVALTGYAVVGLRLWEERRD